MPSEGVRNPQPQFVLNPDGTQTATPLNNPNTGNNLSRTEPGPVLTEAMHLFLNQNNRIDWGRQNYLPGENGGISGIICYQTTRAEEDPRNGTNDPWEPGIPRVQVALYLYDSSVPLPADTLDAAPTGRPGDSDDQGQQWQRHARTRRRGQLSARLGDGGTKGPEDVDKVNPIRTQPPALGCRHDRPSTPATPSRWSGPTVGMTMRPTGSQQPNPPVILGKPIIGSDNYATWNQIRPGVFDGGYAFGDIPAAVNNRPGLDHPPGYKIQTEESINVVFGDAYVPSKLGLVPRRSWATTTRSGLS